MKNISNTFLVKINRISRQCENTEIAMRQNMIQTEKLLHAQYVNDFFKSLIKSKIGNNEIEELSRRI